MSERMFPVQDGADIPWSEAERIYWHAIRGDGPGPAWRGYFSARQSLEDYGRRGGFGIGEIRQVMGEDWEWPPARVRELEAEVERLRAALSEIRASCAFRIGWSWAREFIEIADAALRSPDGPSTDEDKP